jgi:hypothetical protein
MTNTKTNTEDGAKPCNCNVDLVEGSVTINGKKVRFYRCPECNMFMYHQSDLQKVVYNRMPIVEDTNWEEQEAN